MGTVDGATIEGVRIGDMTKNLIKIKTFNSWKTQGKNGFTPIYDELGNTSDINGVLNFDKDIEFYIPLKRESK